MDSQILPVTPIPPVAPVLPPAEKNKNWLKVLLAAIGVLIVLGLFGNLYLLAQNQKPTAEVTPTPTLPAATLTPDETASWKTHTTTKFSFKYPSTWSVGTSADGTILLDSKPVEATKVVEPDQVLITIETITDKNLINSYLANLPGGSEKRIINSVPFDYIIVNYQGGQPPKQVIFAQAKVGNSLYRLGLANISMKDTFDQILSTFKFLDQSQADPTANWKTYTSSVYGFSIKYPDQYVPKDAGNGITTFYDTSLGNEVKKVDIYKDFRGGWGCVVKISSEKIIVDGKEEELFIQAGALAENNCTAEDPNSSRAGILIIKRQDLFWLLELTINRNNETEEINKFKKILSTFQFLQ